MNWIKKNKQEALIILFILVVAGFLRFYKLAEYMTFLGDEGRDALIIKGILVDHHLPLLGPPTSIGDMYLGPLYYYMMAVPMAIFWLNPVAAAGQVALIGVLTVGLIYYFARMWFGKIAAITSSTLYAVSSITVIYSRSSWNPNPTPFFALLALLGLYKSHQTGNFRWFVLTGIALAFAVQMHYLALILIPIFGLLWLNELRIFIRDKSKRPFFIPGTLGAILAFLFLMSPLVIFDFRHDFMNYKALNNLFSSGSSVGFSLIDTISQALPIYQYNLVSRHLSGQITALSWGLSLLLLLPLTYVIFQKIKNRQTYLKWPFLVLGVWLVLGILGLTFYKQTIYDHYVGFLSPVPFLLFGSVAYLGVIFKKYLPLVNGGLIGLVLILVAANLSNNPLKQPPNNQLQKTQNIAKYIIQSAGAKPFNFALISEHNYDAAYQFYLGQLDHQPKALADQKTDQLFVVCEDQECKPVGHAKYEIAAFGWTMIESEMPYEGVRIFKLIHNPDQPPETSL